MRICSKQTCKAHVYDHYFGAGQSVYQPAASNTSTANMHHINARA